MEARLESALLAAVVDTVDEGLLVTDAAGRVLLVNRAFTREAALPTVQPGDDFIGAWEREDAAPELVAMLGRVLRGDASEAAWDTALGKRRMMVRARGLLGTDPARMLVRVVLRTETPSERAPATTLGARDLALEQIERSAEALAHDFNNLLTAVLGSTVSLRATLERALDDTWHIDRAAAHASVLSRRIRTLRTDTRDIAPTDIERLVQELLPMLRAAAGAGIRVEARCDVPLWAVEVDTVEIEQVMMNLVINARDAMSEGGVIDIHVHNLSGDRAYALLRDRTDRVAIHVKDAGQGILPEYVGKVFDPFFTTKEPGRGTGLGLTNVREIVERSQGHVSIQSEPGRGTTVSVYLPRCTAKSEPGLRPVAASFLRGAEVVLVVEDDYRVRITTARALTERGYKVLTASTADEAKRIERDAEGPIDLLLTDVGLAGASGIDLANELARRRPDMQVLFVSGHAEDIAHGPKNRDLLLKPYRPDELAARVRTLLDAVAQVHEERRLLGA